MHNLELKCIDNVLVVVDINTKENIGFLQYNRRFINATLELKATIMNKKPISAQEHDEQYKRDYYLPPQSGQRSKTLKLNEANIESSRSQADSVKCESTTKDIVTRISALSDLVSKVTKIQNTHITGPEEDKPMLVRLSPQVIKATTTQKENSHCPCCNGSGAFVRGRITRTCFRCDGKGCMDDADRKRYQAYLKSRGYANNRTYKDHNNKYSIS
jgi:hypothetical protein